MLLSGRCHKVGISSLSLYSSQSRRVGERWASDDMCPVLTTTIYSYCTKYIYVLHAKFWVDLGSCTSPSRQPSPFISIYLYVECTNRLTPKYHSWQVPIQSTNTAQQQQQQTKDRMWDSPELACSENKSNPVDSIVMCARRGRRSLATLQYINTVPEHKRNKEKERSGILFFFLAWKKWQIYQNV